MGWRKSDIDDLINIIDCPWPEDIWTMTDDEYVKAIPDPKLRTAISGFLMRKGWEVFKSQILKRSEEEFDID